MCSSSFFEDHSLGFVNIFKPQSWQYVSGSESNNCNDSDEIDCFSQSNRICINVISTPWAQRLSIFVRKMFFYCNSQIYGMLKLVKCRHMASLHHCDTSGKDVFRRQLRKLAEIYGEIIWIQFFFRFFPSYVYIYFLCSFQKPHLLTNNLILFLEKVAHEILHLLFSFS